MPYKFNPLSGSLDYYEAGAGGDLWSDPVDSHIVSGTDSTHTLGSLTVAFAAAFADGFITPNNGAFTIRNGSANEAKFSNENSETTLPSGGTVDVAIAGVAEQSIDIGIYGSKDTGTDATNAGSVIIEGGSKTTGTGAGGYVKLRAGDGPTNGTYGYVWEYGMQRVNVQGYAGTATIAPTASTYENSSASADITLTLPGINSDVPDGVKMRFINTNSTYDLTIAPDGTDSISDSTNNITLGEKGDWVELLADGGATTNWIRTGGNTRLLVFARGNTNLAASTTTNIVFDEEVTDIEATWSGSAFTAPRAGTYRVNGFTRWSTSISALRVYIGGSAGEYAGYNGDSTTIMSFIWEGTLASGDTWGLRPTTTGTSADSSDATHFIRIYEVL